MPLEQQYYTTELVNDWSSPNLMTEYYKNRIDRILSARCTHENKQFNGVTALGKYIYCCEKCLSSYIRCSHCECYLKDGESLVCYDNKDICSRCYERYVFECQVCLTENFGEYSRLPNGSRACLSCFEQGAFFCSHCGNSCWLEDINDHRGRSLCSSCYSDYGPPPKILSESFEKNKSKRQVGFELEYFYDGADPNLNSIGKTHEDGSITPEDDDYIGQEFSSVISNGDALFDIIDNATNTIRRSGGKVNKSCGFHVHLDMSQSNTSQRNNIKAWWREFESIFFALVAPSRRNNDFTKGTKNYHLDNEDWAHNRYHALNISAFSKWKTFEVRLHHGTLEADKIKEWISLLLKFFDYFSDKSFSQYFRRKLSKMNDRQKLIWFCNKLDLSLTNKKKIMNRIKSYSKGVSHKVLNLAKAVENV
jgi:hypothetical protein